MKSPITTLSNNLYHAQLKTISFKERPGFLLKTEKQVMPSPEHSNCVMELHSACVDGSVIEFLKR